jgi:predicted neuraminidase
MAKRTLSEWASIAEIISAVAVVASLLYIGFEINRNTRVSLAANRQAIAARAQELAFYSGESKISRLLFQANDDISLTESEQNRVTAYVGALLRTTEEAFLLYRDGMLDEE